MLKIISKVFLAVLFAACVHAEPVRVFELRHQPAEALLSPLRGLVEPETRLAAQGARLIARGTEQELEKVSDLVQQLDRAPSNLVIHVRQETGQGGRFPSRQGTRILGSERQQVSLQGASRIGNTARGVTQTLRVVDGEEASLTVGRDVAMTEAMAVTAGRHLGYAESITWQRVATGFQVRPVLLDGEALVDIVPWMQNLAAADPRTIEFRELHSTLRLPLGVWTQVSTALFSDNRAGGDAVVYRSGTGHQTDNLWLMIELASGPAGKSPTKGN